MAGVGHLGGMAAAYAVVAGRACGGCGRATTAPELAKAGRCAPQSIHARDATGPSADYVAATPSQPAAVGQRQGSSFTAPDRIRASRRARSPSAAGLFASPLEVTAGSRRKLKARAQAESSNGVATSTAPATAGDALTDFKTFKKYAKEGNAVPLVKRIFSDHLTPVTAYRCLVREDDREAPSFLMESVVDGDKAGRYSYVGAHPDVEIVATGHRVVLMNHGKGTRTVTVEEDPMEVPVRLAATINAVETSELPKEAFTGGWAGYTSYDTVRYVEGGKIPFSSAPVDDRQLPDIHLGLYKEVVVFDHVFKIVYLICWVFLDEESSLKDAYEDGVQRLVALAARVHERPPPDLGPGNVGLELGKRGSFGTTTPSTMTKKEYMAAVETAREHIRAGDIFQVVLSHRFERRTFADPFEVYRALRIVNPSPYMIYLQARGCIMVASSPEILCRVKNRKVFNRPLAGTRRRGSTPEEDAALQAELLADEKERAEHVMLVDLGRNDVGRVSKAGSVRVEKLFEVERYSHVMHISSTVTGELLPALDCWDALRAALPVGTVSGAPKVRAMQIIDDLEKTRRGPYGGGVGLASFLGGMDMALALRTMVIPTASTDTMYSYAGPRPRREWVVHLQCGAGIVADSNPEHEWEETVNKGAGLSRAIDLAEHAFLGAPEMPVPGD